MKTRMAGLALAGWCGAVCAEESRPNIILIFTDDQGYTDLGIHGFDSDVRTPHLDQLASDGVLFTAGYVTAPQCIPARAGLITGRHQNAFGLDDNRGGPLSHDEYTIAERLQDVGYVTGMVGKWHLEVGFDENNQPQFLTDYLPHRHGFEEYFSGYMQRYHASHDLSGNPLPDPPQIVEDDRFRVDIQTEAALSFLERRETDDRPFFLYLAYYAPHAPMEDPEHYMEQLLHVEDVERRMGLAAVLAMDTGVGRIRERLAQMGIAEDTLIFYISDNGAPLIPGNYIGSHNEPLIGEKGMLTDGGQRVPYLAAWPGTIAPQQVITNMVSSLDASATVLAAGGATNQWDAIEGVDLMPFMLGETSGPVREVLYWRWRSQAAIRRGGWKFVRLGDEYRYLFDMTRLGEETIEFCRMDDFPGVAIELEEELLAHADTWHTTGLPDGAINAQDRTFFATHVDPEVSRITYTWSGGNGDHANWGAPLNWHSGLPPFDHATDLIWHRAETPADRRTSYMGPSDRMIRSVEFNRYVTNSVLLTTQASAVNTETRQLIFETSGDQATAWIETDPEAFADITIGNRGGLVLNSDLRITHNGSGVLTLGGGSSSFAGAGAITLDGGGTVLFGDPVAGTAHAGTTTIARGTLLTPRQRGVKGILDSSTHYVTVKSGATLAVSIEFTDEQIGRLFSNPGTRFEAGARFGLDTGLGDRLFDGALGDTVDGSLGLVVRGGNTLTLAGDNTYSGDTVVNGGSKLELANGGSLAFTIGDDGVNNQITGAGTVNLNGTIVFDLVGAGSTPGDSWTVVGNETDATYGSTFSVGGFDDEGSGIWTKGIDGETRYEFDEATGVLQVKTSASPEPEPFAIGELAIEPVVGGDLAMTVHFDSTGHAYTLQFRSNLVSGVWEDLVSGTESPLVYTNETAQGFFRIKAEQ